jgi:hypothetical protein
VLWRKSKRVKHSLVKTWKEIHRELPRQGPAN